jgi:hypothetical protein
MRVFPLDVVLSVSLIPSRCARALVFDHGAELDGNVYESYADPSAPDASGTGLSG